MGESMRITAIEKKSGTKYTVYVDDEYWYILDLEIIMQNQLRVNQEVDEDFLDQVLVQAERRKARERAYYLLGYRDHSKKELYDKLLKSARPEIALEIVQMVEEQGLIDDQAYAQKLAAYYLTSKKWGARRAVFEMQKKGIDKELALSCVDECEVDTVAQIRTIIEKKYYRYAGDYKGNQKVIAGLMRMGFDYSDIKSAIAEYCDSLDQFDDDEFCE